MNRIRKIRERQKRACKECFIPMDICACCETCDETKKAVEVEGNIYKIVKCPECMEENK